MTSADSGLLSRMERIEIREAVRAEASLVHTGILWDRINAFECKNNTFLERNVCC